jgi:hypothetical protein
MEYIYEARDIIPRAFCEEMIEKFENDPKKTSVVTGGVRLNKK